MEGGEEGGEEPGGGGRRGVRGARAVRGARGVRGARWSGVEEEERLGDHT